MNNNFQLRKAERKQAKLRIGMSGPSGSGKTYGALLLARGITEWEKIVLIDTENKSGDLYSDLGAYNVITLEEPFSPERYIEAIQACENAGMDVIIIDSITHEWDGEGGCLRSNELLANAKFRGNTWAAWSQTTPRHQRFIDKIISSNCHMITTVRNKQETIQTEDKKIKKVGMKEVTREGFEYELTLNFNIDRDGHHAVASKDRTGLFETADPFVISEDTGKTLSKWNNSGIVDVDAQKKQIMIQLGRIGFDTSTMTGEEVEFEVHDFTKLKLVEKNFDKIISKLRDIKTGERETPEEEIGNEPPFEDQDTGPVEEEIIVEEPQDPPVQEKKPATTTAEPKPKKMTVAAKKMHDAKVKKLLEMKLEKISVTIVEKGDNVTDVEGDFVADVSIGVDPQIIMSNEKYKDILK